MISKTRVLKRRRKIKYSYTTGLKGDYIQNRCSCENELRINLTNDKLYELNETGSEVYSYVTKCSYVMELSMLRIT